MRDIRNVDVPQAFITISDLMSNVETRLSFNMTEHIVELILVVDMIQRVLDTDAHHMVNFYSAF